MRPKKHLGQHFLHDGNIARKIVNGLPETGFDVLLEVGPGQGALTRYLLPRYGSRLHAVEIDGRAVVLLKQQYPELAERILEGDFLKLDIAARFTGQVAVAGNFPYNISSQILFRILEQRERILHATGMFQKEVADRIRSAPGSKAYGILSVLVQAFYEVEYLFTVSENVFFPRPKVKSAVLRLTRKSNIRLDCDERLFFTVVKAAFGKRRKTLRNALKNFTLQSPGAQPFLQRRAEELSVEDFVCLTRLADQPAS